MLAVFCMPRLALGWEAFSCAPFTRKEERNIKALLGDSLHQTVDQVASKKEKGAPENRLPPRNSYGAEGGIGKDD